MMDFEEALELVRQTISRLSSEHAIPSDLEIDGMSGATEIDELGLDSLDKLKIVQELQRVTGASISDERIGSVVTAGDLAQCIADGISDELPYHGGETFDLADVMLRGRQLNLADRCALCNEFLKTLRDRQQLTVMRELLSPLDREIVVSDPETHQAQRLLMFGSNGYLGLATHPRVMARVQE